MRRRRSTKNRINSNDPKVSFDKMLDVQENAGFEEEASELHTLPSSEYLSDEIYEQSTKEESESIEQKRVTVVVEEDSDDEMVPEEKAKYRARRKSTKKKLSLFIPAQSSSESLTKDKIDSSIFSRRRSRGFSEVDDGRFGRRKSSLYRERSRSKSVKMEFVEAMKKKMEQIRASISRSDRLDADLKASTSTSLSDSRGRITALSSSGSSSTGRSRLRKKEKKKFSKRRYIKKLKKLDRKIKAAQKLKNQTAVTKKDAFEKWNSTIEKFLIAKHHNENLKKKVTSLDAIEKTGLWETTRRIRNDKALTINKQMRTLGAVYTRALAGALKDMDKHNYALFKKIIDSDRSRLRIREEMELFLNKFWKEENEKENLYIKQFNTYLGTKEDHLDISFKRKLKNLSDKFTNAFESSMQLNDIRLKKVFRENYKKIEKCLQVYSGITENNFFFIKELSIKINGLKWKEIVTRNNLDKLIKQKKDMTERYNYLQEINVELSREVTSGKRVRRELLREIKQKKSLEFETNVALINYEFKEHENTQSSQTLAKTRENLKKHLVKQKKEFFKTWILQSTKISEQVLYEHYFKEIIELLDDKKRHKSKTLSANEELYVPYEGLRVTVGDFETIPMVETEEEYRECRKSYNTVIDYYKKRIAPQCMRIEDLNFLLKDKPSLINITNYAKQESGLIDQIKQDTKMHSTSGTKDSVRTWSVKSINYN